MLPEASRRLLISFYETGVADVSQFAHQPVDLAVGLGYPVQAKLGLAAIVLIVAGLVALVWFIVRRVRPRGTR